MVTCFGHPQQPSQNAGWGRTVTDAEREREREREIYIERASSYNTADGFKRTRSGMNVGV